MAENEGGLLAWLKRKFDRTASSRPSTSPGRGPQGEDPLKDTTPITDSNVAFLRGLERAASGGRNRGELPEIGIDPMSYPPAKGPAEEPSKN